MRAGGVPCPLQVQEAKGNHEKRAHLDRWYGMAWHVFIINTARVGFRRAQRFTSDARPRRRRQRRPQAPCTCRAARCAACLWRRRCYRSLHAAGACLRPRTSSVDASSVRSVDTVLVADADAGQVERNAPFFSRVLSLCQVIYNPITRDRRFIPRPRRVEAVVRVDSESGASCRVGCLGLRLAACGCLGPPRKRSPRQA